MTPERVVDLNRNERAELAATSHAAHLGSRLVPNPALHHARRLRPLPLTEAAGASGHPPDPATLGALPGLGAEREAMRAVEAGTLASLPDRSRLAFRPARSLTMTSAGGTS